MFNALKLVENLSAKLANVIFLPDQLLNLNKMLSAKILDTAGFGAGT